MLTKTLVEWCNAAIRKHEKHWTLDQQDRPIAFKVECLEATRPKRATEIDYQIAFALLMNRWNELQKWFLHPGSWAQTYFEESIEQLRRDAGINDSDTLNVYFTDGAPAIAVIHGAHCSVYVQDAELKKFERR